MAESLNASDIVFLSSKNWWTANSTNPYIVKGGVQNNSYMILVSDCFHVWFSKSDEKTIKFNHAIFNRSINIEKTSDILGLMEDFLVKGDSKAVMEFIEVSAYTLLLKVKIELKVCCPFTWEFELHKVKTAAGQHFLLGQFIGPLVKTVHCLENRTEFLKQQFYEMEEDYKKRLTPLEKNTFKSRFIDEEFTWTQLVGNKFNESHEKIENLEFEEAGRYFMTQATKSFYGILNYRNFKFRIKLFTKGIKEEINSNNANKNIARTNTQNLREIEREEPNKKKHLHVERIPSKTHLGSSKKKTRKSKSKSKEKEEEEKKPDKKVKKEKKNKLDFL